MPQLTGFEGGGSGFRAIVAVLAAKVCSGAVQPMVKATSL
jgi:hypothetical protein